MALTMNSRRTMHLLLVLMTASACGLSCNVSESQAVVDKRKLQSDKSVLSEQEMIDIANAVGRRRIPNPEKWGAAIDEENYYLKAVAVRLSGREGGPPATDDEVQAVILRRWPVLKGHDYQAAWYNVRPPTMLGSSLGILIDKHTGEVIVVLTERGEALKPQPVNMPPRTKGTLSSKELSDIASAVGRFYGGDPNNNEWMVLVDEGNTRWCQYAISVLWLPRIDENGHPHWPKVTDRELEAGIEKRWPMLKDHHYQALRYSRRSSDSRTWDWGMLFLISKDTGEVLMSVSGLGDVLNPKRGLSHQELIGIATAAGQQRNLSYEGWEPFIDEGNAGWRSGAVGVLYSPRRGDGGRAVWPEVKDEELDAAILKRWPMLKGHDYQAVIYLPLPRKSINGLDTTLIDRNTGDVLAVLDGHGEVIPPKTK
jgi:hypothetical protein